VTAGEWPEEHRLYGGSVLVSHCRDRRRTQVSGYIVGAVVITIPYSVAASQSPRPG